MTHSAGEYARTVGAVRVHTNTAEGFFGLFKMALTGIHHAVSPKHLHRYATEHTFRRCRTDARNNWLQLNKAKSRRAREGGSATRANYEMPKLTNY